MNLIKPEKLNAGDTIGILATSGAYTGNKDSILQAVSYFEQRGYNIVMSENLFCKDRYLAGNDEKRVEELHKMFINPHIKAIVCLRGGYGAIRIVNKIDYSVIRQNPKIFCGYSDITALNAMFLKRAGLITFSGPMVLSDFAKDTCNVYTTKEFFNTLTNGTLSYKIDKIYKKGNAEGIFWGGNLSTLVSLCGQDFIPDKKFIFFTEDLNEPVYKIDKMFRQLINIESFRKNIQAIVLGDFIELDKEEWFEDLIKEITSELNIPVVKKNGITHLSRKITVPYGINTKLVKNTLFFENYLQ